MAKNRPGQGQETLSRSVPAHPLQEVHFPPVQKPEVHGKVDQEVQMNSVKLKETWSGTVPSYSGCSGFPSGAGNVGGSCIIWRFANRPGLMLEFPASHSTSSEKYFPSPAPTPFPFFSM